MSTCSTPPRTQSPKPPLVAIIGTTGVGKSQLGIDLARWLAAGTSHPEGRRARAGAGGGGEVLNADSMQVYKGLDVITNKVTEEEKGGVRHHLMGFLESGEEYSVGEFQKDAMEKVSWVGGGGGGCGSRRAWLRAGPVEKPKLGWIEETLRNGPCRSASSKC